MPQHSSLEPHRSQRQSEWVRALSDGDIALLGQLAAQDDPSAALYVLEAYINSVYRGMAYRGSLPPLSIPMAEIASKIPRVSPFVDEIRERLGWCIREFDLGLLRLIRRSSALSPVLGAGVSMGAGAPSWSDLVRLLLEETLDKGLELRVPVSAADNPAQPPIQMLPDGQVVFDLSHLGESIMVEYRVGEVRHYSAEQEALARAVLAEVREKDAATDIETLMKGAQVCFDLCGQELFRLLTGVIYKRAKAPSETHRAIARLAHAQSAPDRGPGLFPGWESIITYNFDALMSEALAEEKIPHVAWAMSSDEMAGDPDKLALDSEWRQQIFHLHGYTPRRLFLITNTHYVFSTSQYLTTYTGPRAQILQFVFDQFLANPVHVALYIGCSFSDEAMNNLLRDAFQRFPGRYHYALLKWPYDRKGSIPTGDEVKAESAKYLEIGIRPVWFDNFEELPGLIGQLQ